MKAIAFVTRVHPERSSMLKVCVESVRMQTSNDYIHILYRHDKTKKGYGKLEANKSFEQIKSIPAHYVMVLDDDDMLIDAEFVEIFREKTKGNDPEIVFFKGTISGRAEYPRPEIWGKAPVLAKIASFCFAVRLDVWKNHIHEFGARYSGGDFCFISACYKNTTKYLWINRVVARTQKNPGGGRAEDEHP